MHFRRGAQTPSVQVPIYDFVIAGANRHSLFFLVIFRDEVFAKISHYGGPPVFASYGIDKFCRIFGTIDGTLLQCFEEHIWWQRIMLSCGLRQYIGLLVLRSWEAPYAESEEKLLDASDGCQIL